MTIKAHLVCLPLLLGASLAAGQDKTTDQKAADRAAEFQRRQEEMRKQREAEQLRYHFAVGQTFGYYIEITVDRGDFLERYAGSPIFTPKFIEKGGHTDHVEIGAVGKLSYATKGKEAKDFTEQPGQAIWVSTRIVTDTSAKHVVGKPDLTKSTLPETLFNVIPLKSFLFIELPEKVGGRLSDSGSGWASITSPGSLVGAGFRMVDGRVTSAITTEAISDTLVRVRKEKSFKGKEGTNVEIKYESTGRFDRKRGLLLDCEATFASQIENTKTSPIKITIRLLEGDALMKAFEQATKDWAQLPASLDPFEFRRVRIELDKADRFKSAQDLKAGMTVAHFHEDRHWYLAKVTDIGADNYKVGIRLTGSNEDLVVHPGTLASVPAEKMPKK